MMDGPQRNINAADLNHFKCKCLLRGVMQMRIEWKRLKLFPLLNANIFLTLSGVRHEKQRTQFSTFPPTCIKETIVLQNDKMCNTLTYIYYSHIIVDCF